MALNGCHKRVGALDTEWVEDKDAAKHPKCIGQLLIAKNHLGKNANSVSAEKPQADCGGGE